jgi:type I restriction enzyme S subunit
MNALPGEWQCDRLKDVSQINVSVLAADTDPDYEFDYLEISNVNYYGIVDQSAIERIRFEDAPSRARRRVSRKTTLISSVRPNLQAVAFISNGRADLVCSTGFNVVQSLEHKLSPKFCYYALISEGARQYFEATAKGVGYPAVDDKDFNSLNLPLPPPPEQERIAAYLDASCASIDTAVAAKRRQLETLDALRGSTIAHVVTKGLDDKAPRRDSGIELFGDVPQHWRCEHLKRYAARIQTGVTPPTERHDYYIDGTIPWFAPGSYDGEIELQSPRKLINELAKDEGALRMFPAETVFLIGIGATIGKVALIAEPASCNQQIIGIVTNHRLLPRYLAYQMKIYEDVIPGIAVATTLPIFDQVKTAYLPILAPPRKEQHAICTFLDLKLAEVRRIVRTINDQIATLIAYRKSLIHECVTGQRRISDADLQPVQTQWQKRNRRPDVTVRKESNALA